MKEGRANEYWLDVSLLLAKLRGSHKNKIGNILWLFQWWPIKIQSRSFTEEPCHANSGRVLPPGPAAVSTCTCTSPSTVLQFYSFIQDLSSFYSGCLCVVCVTVCQLYAGKSLPWAKGLKTLHCLNDQFILSEDMKSNLMSFYHNEKKSVIFSWFVASVTVYSLLYGFTPDLKICIQLNFSLIHFFSESNVITNNNFDTLFFNWCLWSFNGEAKKRPAFFVSYFNEMTWISSQKYQSYRNQRHDLWKFFVSDVWKLWIQRLI